MITKPPLLLIDKTSMSVLRITPSEASQITTLSPDDILWAIGDAGRCDVGHLIIVLEKYEDGEML